MVEPQEPPRIFGLPPGANFTRDVARQLRKRFENQPPEAMARVQLFVNSSRMRKSLTTAFCEAGAALLPRMTVVSELASIVPWADIPPASSHLNRQLEFARLLQPLLNSASAPAPRSALFDLADTLIALLDEMHTESVPLETILETETEGAPRHWAEAQRFLSIIQNYLDITSEERADDAARQRLAMEHLKERWRAAPPQTPIFVIGSTGSRGTTFELMKAVAALPQGALVLPGFDFDLPPAVWARLQSEPREHEDHPQFRFAALLSSLHVSPDRVKSWGPAPDPDRNALISLSLRPAPVTDQWRIDGKRLGNLSGSTNNISLIEAAHKRAEAETIAAAVREGLSRNQVIALVTPDRDLTRRVSAALERWGVIADDSAGVPLSLSPPGRFLRMIARAMGAPVTPVDLIAVLRHPLARSGGDDRGAHALNVNALELHLRRQTQPTISPELVTDLAEKGTIDQTWCLWLAEVVARLTDDGSPGLADLAMRHVSIAQDLARGSSDASGGLWDAEAGRVARDAMVSLSDAENTVIERADYIRLVEHTLSRQSVRSPDQVREDVMIWGTLEARALDADLVILGGLNERTWPAAAKPDAWLSRSMRRATGMMSPERQTGLSAHDFQIAVCAPTVILTRSLRDDGAETVASRWLNRLKNLLGGLPDQGGEAALNDMLTRGERLSTIAASLDAPSRAPEPEVRPAPAPPSAARPKKLSVTAIEKLIRDPYWIYARHVLRLKAVDPLMKEPSAALRGDVFHKVLERVISDCRETKCSVSVEYFLDIARKTLDEMVPWQSTRCLWFGHLEAIADDFVTAETERQTAARNIATEVSGELALSGTDFVITGKADRVDQRDDDQLLVYDYKSGQVPNVQQIKHFNPQILIEAVMLEHGAFDDIPATIVAEGAYVSLGRAGLVTRVEMADQVLATRNSEPLDLRVATTEKHLESLLSAYAQASRGYPSRRAMEKERFEGDFDHLARFGEWDETMPWRVIPLP
ncbi:MAG: double-strand break repair protein AddB [Pseudomonadota bacterium]